jgi:hypothetical protein
MTGGGVALQVVGKISELGRTIDSHRKLVDHVLSRSPRPSRVKSRAVPAIAAAAPPAPPAACSVALSPTPLEASKRGAGLKAMVLEEKAASAAVSPDTASRQDFAESAASDSEASGTDHSDHQLPSTVDAGSAPLSSGEVTKVELKQTDDTTPSPLVKERRLFRGASRVALSLHDISMVYVDACVAAEHIVRPPVASFHACCCYVYLE